MTSKVNNGPGEVTLEASRKGPEGEAVAAEQKSTNTATDSAKEPAEAEVTALGFGWKG